MRANQVSLITVVGCLGVSGCFYDKLEIDPTMGSAHTGGKSGSTTQRGSAGNSSVNSAGNGTLGGSTSTVGGRTNAGGAGGTPSGSQSFASSAGNGGSQGSGTTEVAAGANANLGGADAGGAGSTSESGAPSSTGGRSASSLPGGATSTLGGNTNTLGGKGGTNPGGTSGVVASSGSSSVTPGGAPPNVGGTGGKATGGAATGGYVATGGSPPKPECETAEICKTIVASSLDQCHQAACTLGKCQVVPSAGASCKSPSGANGACTDVGNCSVCHAGDYQCSDKTLLVCPTSEADIQTVCSGQICDASAHACYGCQPNTAVGCDPLNTKQRVWCDASGAQVSQTSTDSTKQYCTGTGTWVACLSTPNCPDQSYPVCKEKYCDSNTCTSKNSAYNTPCTLNGLSGACDDAGGHCIVCSTTDKQYRCTGAQLEQCNTDGSGYSPFGSACASAALCSPGYHQCLKCDPNQAPSCVDGRTLRECIDNGLTLRDTTTTPQFCSGGQIVQCLANSDCTQPANPCQEITCNQSTHTCAGSATNRASGLACASVGTCNGSGTCIGPHGPSYLASATKCRGGTMDCNESRLILGGSFLMGRGTSGTDAFSSGSSSEAPEHSATVGNFFIDTFEVTVSRFRQFYANYDLQVLPYLTSTFGQNPNLTGSGWQAAWPALSQTNLKNYFTGVSSAAGVDDCLVPNWPASSSAATDPRPMNCINWYEAFAFCAWDGGRLPTEAEWEYVAAGAGANKLYPWGAAAPSATYVDNSATDAAVSIVVGSFPSGIGTYGQYDLAGSMGEWVLDLYSSTFYTTAACNNCANLATGTNRVVRGGSVRDFSQYDRAAARWGDKPAAHLDYRGIRCVRDPR